jgi:hypothetical protein
VPSVPDNQPVPSRCEIGWEHHVDPEAELLVRVHTFGKHDLVGRFSYRSDRDHDAPDRW